MHWISPTPSNESEIWTLIKRIKTIDINRKEIFQNSRDAPFFYHKINGEILEEMEV
jgi:hypothetical protein